MQGALRAGVGLFLLSGSCVLSAHAATESLVASADSAVVAKRSASPKYQMKEVSGYVYDGATGKPLGGVKVQSLNNRLYSALTEDDGKYTISVPKFVDVLYVSLQDYNPTHLAIKGAANQNVYLNSGMHKDFFMDGTSLTNSTTLMVTDPNAITIEEEMENGLAGSLRLINRGGMPGQGATIFMNGLNSIHSNSQPLIVIDGVIMDMQFDRSTLHEGFYNNLFNIMDPDDIESVEVLKNGTALYGAQGANGVILINTRRGKSMVTRIKFRAYAGWEQSPEKIKMMNADQYRNYISELIGTIPDRDYLGSSQIEFLNEDKNYYKYPIYHNSTDWQKDLYDDVFTQNYKIAVEGGDDIAKYNLSLGYTMADATAVKNDFNRLNIRFNTDVSLFKNFTTAIDLAYARNAYNLRDNGWAEDYSQSNIASPNVLGLIQTPFLSPYTYVKYSEDGNISYMLSEKVYAGKDGDSGENPFRFITGYGYDALVNPMWILANGDGDNKNYQEQTQFNLNVAPKYQVNKYLTLQDRFSYVLNRSNERYYLPANGTPSKSVDGLGYVSSLVATQFAKETTLFNDFTVDWQRTFGAHDLHVFGGFRFASYSYNQSYAKGYNNENDKTPNMSNTLDYRTNGGYNDTWVNLTYYANAAYNFRNKYFLTAGASMQSSSRFGKEADEGVKLCGVRWGIFPNVEAAWVASSERWFKVKGINYLKLAAGFDMSGNDNIDYYATRTYFENIKFMDKATALILSNIQNQKLQWETTKRYNVSLFLSMLKNRLNVGVEYYHAKTTNLLNRKSVSDITGLPYVWSNDGALKNDGIDINISGMVIQHKDWRWQIGATIGHYKNEITALPQSELNTIKSWSLDENGNKEQLYSINGSISTIYGANVLTAKGHAAGVFYGYQTAGVFSSDAEASSAGKYGYLRYPTGISEDPYRNFKAGDMHFVDQNGDGWINEADMVVIGDPNPDIFGNIFTSLQWKHLKLDVSFKYSLGNDVYNYQRSQLESMTNHWNQTTAVVNRWRYEGQKTDMPRLMDPNSETWVNNERFSDRWIEDGSYLKLKRVRLTYQIPMRVSWLQGLAVWGEANDVFTITKYTGTDPEFSVSNSVLYQGIDAGYLPQSRNFCLGLTVNL